MHFLRIAILLFVVAGVLCQSCLREDPIESRITKFNGVELKAKGGVTFEAKEDYLIAKNLGLGQEDAITIDLSKQIPENTVKPAWSIQYESPFLSDQAPENAERTHIFKDENGNVIAKSTVRKEGDERVLKCWNESPAINGVKIDLFRDGEVVASIDRFTGTEIRALKPNGFNFTGRCKLVCYLVPVFTCKLECEIDLPITAARFDIQIPGEGIFENLDGYKIEPITTEELKVAPVVIYTKGISELKIQDISIY